MKKMIVAVILLFITTILVSCHKEQATKNRQPLQMVTAQLKAVPTELFYSGTVSPIQIYNIASPSDGTVKEIDFKYGQKVKKGDRLLVISSAKLQEDYHTALTNYLKAAEDYNNAKINFQGSQELKKANIIPDQQFLSEKQQYDNTVLAFVSAKITLEQLIKKIPSAQKLNFETLSVSDVSQLSQILQVQYSDLVITADRDGVVLSPQKSSDSGESADGSSDSGKNLIVGSQIKEGQALVAIGDLSGIATTVQVSEMVINQIKPGQRVTVNLEAIPDINFNGNVKSVGAQAQASQEGQTGVASFPVNIVVPQVSQTQMQLIRVGMTAKVQITIQNPAQIMIPITAVYQKNGASMVTILEPTGKQVLVPVVTGPTSLSDVAIMQGLKAGDRIVIPASPAAGNSDSNQ